MQPTTKAHWQIHFCVLLWGFTAILGKLISLPALELVWWRLLIVTACLALVPRVWRGLRAQSPRLTAIYAGIGVLVTLHWLTFYGAIKLANASVAVTCLALAPGFLALVEPWIARRPFDWRELLLGVAVLPGVALVVGGIPAGMHVGVLVGRTVRVEGAASGDESSPSLDSVVRAAVLYVARKSSARWRARKESVCCGGAVRGRAVPAGAR